MLSPVVANADESQATLRFADCAKQVMQHTRITEMKVIDKQYVEKMEHELNELRAKVIQYENDNGGEIIVNNNNIKMIVFWAPSWICIEPGSKLEQGMGRPRGRLGLDLDWDRARALSLIHI